VLFWGILGVIVLRAIMIGLGATLVSEFAWVLYIFACLPDLHRHQDVADGRQGIRRRQQPADRLAQAPLARDRPRCDGEKFFVQAADPKTGKTVCGHDAAVPGAGA
jgi:tellurite resistance protein TerC